MSFPAIRNLSICHNSYIKTWLINNAKNYVIQYFNTLIIRLTFRYHCLCKICRDIIPIRIPYDVFEVEVTYIHLYLGNTGKIK